MSCHLEINTQPADLCVWLCACIFVCSVCLSVLAIGLVQAAHELFVWCGWLPEQSEDERSVGSLKSQFVETKKLAFETASSYLEGESYGCHVHMSYVSTNVCVCACVCHCACVCVSLCIRACGCAFMWSMLS